MDPGELTPLDRYGVAVEFLVREGSVACERRATATHFDAIGYVYRSAWYVRWWRERRFSRLQRTHERVGNSALRRAHFNSP